MTGPLLSLPVPLEAPFADVCALEQITRGTGVCALVDGQQIAIVRTADGAVFAIGNFDPFSKANVLSRGIVGDRGGVPKIASPLYKQGFDLTTGACLDDPSVSVPAYDVKLDRGRVLVSRTPRAGAP